MIWQRSKVAPEVRFWRHVDKSGGGDCWLWTGATDLKGYGRFQVGSGRGTTAAHRFAWAMEHGEVPRGLIVMHQCDNRRCVNAKHLMLGTSWANSRDMVNKGRSAKGEQHSQAVLTEETVIELRRRVANGEHIKSVAAELGVHPSNVQAALYTNWRHLPPFRRVAKSPHKGRRVSLPEAVVLDVRRRYQAGEEHSAIAADIGCSPRTVRNAVQGKGKFGLIPGAVRDLHRPDLSSRHRKS